MSAVTLRCECGGRVEVQTGSYPEDDDGNPTGEAIELYECVECGRIGTYSFGDGRDRTSGCVTTSGVVL